MGVDANSLWGTQLHARLVTAMMRRDLPFLARPLARHAARLDITWLELAGSLGCSTLALNMLACCRAPRPDMFDVDVDELAAYTGIDESKLRELCQAMTDRAQST